MWFDECLKFLSTLLEYLPSMSPAVSNAVSVANNDRGLALVEELSSSFVPGGALTQVSSDTLAAEFKNDSMLDVAGRLSMLDASWKGFALDLDQVPVLQVEAAVAEEAIAGTVKNALVSLSSVFESAHSELVLYPESDAVTDTVFYLSSMLLVPTHPMLSISILLFNELVRALAQTVMVAPSYYSNITIDGSLSVSYTTLGAVCAQYTDGTQQYLWGCDSPPTFSSNRIAVGIPPQPGITIASATANVVWYPSSVNRGLYGSTMRLSLHLCPPTATKLAQCNQTISGYQDISIYTTVINRGFNRTAPVVNITASSGVPVSRIPIQDVDQDGDSKVVIDTVLDEGPLYGMDISDAFPTVSTDINTGNTRVLCVNGMQQPGNDSHTILRATHDVLPRTDSSISVQYTYGVYTFRCVNSPAKISLPAKASFTQLSGSALEVPGISCEDDDNNPLQYFPAGSLPHPNITWVEGFNKFVWPSPQRGIWSFQSCCGDSYQSTPTCGDITYVTIDDQRPVATTIFAPIQAYPNDEVDFSVLPGAFADGDDPAESLLLSVTELGKSGSSNLVNATTGVGFLKVPAGMPKKTYAYEVCATDPAPYAKKGCTVQYLIVGTKPVTKISDTSFDLQGVPVGQYWRSDNLLDGLDNSGGYNLTAQASSLPTGYRLVQTDTEVYVETLSAPASRARVINFKVNTVIKDSLGGAVGTPSFDAKITVPGLPPVISPFSSLRGPRTGARLSVNASDPERGPLTASVNPDSGVFKTAVTDTGVDVYWDESAMPTGTTYRPTLRITDEDGQSSEAALPIAVNQPPRVVQNPVAATVFPGQTINLRGATFSDDAPIDHYTLTGATTFNSTTGLGAYTAPAGMPAGLVSLTQCAYEGAPDFQSTCIEQPVIVNAGSITAASSTSFELQGVSVGQYWRSGNLLEAVDNPYGYDVGAQASLPTGYRLVQTATEVYIETDSAPASRARVINFKVNMVVKDSLGAVVGTPSFDAKIAVPGLPPVISPFSSLRGPRTGARLSVNASDPEHGPLIVSVNPDSGVFKTAVTDTGVDVYWDDSAMPTGTTYRPTLKITDEDGQSSEAVLPIAVNQPPRVVQDPVVATVLPGQTINLRGATFSDDAPIDHYTMDGATTVNSATGAATYTAPAGMPIGLITLTQCAYEGAPDFQFTCVNQPIIINSGAIAQVASDSLALTSNTVGQYWRSSNLLAAFNNDNGYNISLQALGLPQSYRLVQDTSGIYVETDRVPATLIRNFNFKVKATLTDTAGVTVGTPTFDATLAIPALNPEIVSHADVRGNVLGGSFDVSATAMQGGSLTCSLGNTFGFLQTERVGSNCRVFWGPRLSDDTNVRYNVVVQVQDQNNLISTEEVTVFIDDLGFNEVAVNDFNGTISSGLRQVDCARAFADPDGRAIRATIAMNPELAVFFTALTESSGVINPASGIQLLAHFINCTGTDGIHTRSKTIAQLYQNQSPVAPRDAIAISYQEATGLLWQEPPIFSDADGSSDIVAKHAAFLPAGAVYTPGIGINFPAGRSGRWCDDDRGPRLIATDKSGASAIAKLCVRGIPTPFDLKATIQQWSPSVSIVILGGLILKILYNYKKNQRIHRQLEGRMNNYSQRLRNLQKGAVHKLEHKRDGDERDAKDEEEVRRKSVGEFTGVLCQARSALNKGVRSAKVHPDTSFRSTASSVSLDSVHVGDSPQAVSRRLRSPTRVDRVRTLAQGSPVMTGDFSFQSLDELITDIAKRVHGFKVMSSSKKIFTDAAEEEAFVKDLRGTALLLAGIYKKCIAMRELADFQMLLERALELYCLTADAWSEFRKAGECVYDQLGAAGLLLALTTHLHDDLHVVGKADRMSEEEFLKKTLESRPWVLQLNTQILRLLEFIYNHDIFGQKNPLVVSTDLKFNLTRLQTDIIKALRSTRSLQHVMIAEQVRALVLIFPDTMVTRSIAFLKDLLYSLACNRAHFDELKFQLGRGIPRQWVASTQAIRSLAMLAIEYQDPAILGMMDEVYKISSVDPHVQYWMISTASNILSRSSNDELSLSCLLFLERALLKKFKLSTFANAKGELLSALVYPSLMAFTRNSLLKSVEVHSSDDESSRHSEDGSSGTPRSEDTDLTAVYHRVVKAALHLKYNGYLKLLETYLFVDYASLHPDAQKTYHAMLVHLLYFCDEGAVRFWLDAKMKSPAAQGAGAGVGAGAGNSAGSLVDPLRAVLYELLAQLFQQKDCPTKIKAYAYECARSGAAEATRIVGDAVHSSGSLRGRAAERVIGALRSVRSASPARSGSPSSAGGSLWSPSPAATAPGFFATVNPLSPAKGKGAALVVPAAANQRSSTAVSGASFHRVVTAMQRKGVVPAAPPGGGSITPANLAAYASGHPSVGRK